MSRRVIYRKEAALESKFLRFVLKVDARIKNFKLVVPSQAGYPDRLLVLPGGKTLFVELKAKGEKLRPLQEERRAELYALGHPVIVITGDENLDVFIELLGKLMELTP
jgi:hypothetical protein